VFQTLSRRAGRPEAISLTTEKPGSAATAACKHSRAACNHGVGQIWGTLTFVRVKWNQ
jgi:hypothetical protein